MSRNPVRIVRVVAVSGAAAAALLGVADTAAAVTHPTVAARSVTAVSGTPVSWSAAGRTITVSGLPTTHYTATDAHRAAVAGLTLPSPAPAVGTNPTGTVVPANVTTQSTAGTVGVGVVALLVVGVVVYFGGIKPKKVTPGWGVTLVTFGVLLAPTFVGSTANQLTSSLVSSAASVLGNL